jgi:hypothetical protein
MDIGPRRMGRRFTFIINREQWSGAAVEQPRGIIMIEAQGILELKPKSRAYSLPPLVPAQLAPV